MVEEEILEMSRQKVAMVESLADLGLSKPRSGRGMLGKAQAVSNSESHERSLQILHHPHQKEIFLTFLEPGPKGGMVHF